MNKIEKLRESLTTLFQSEGEKFCCTPTKFAGCRSPWTIAGSITP